MAVDEIQLKALQAVMTAAEPDPLLPERTRQERKAGRVRIEAQLRASILEGGRDNLMRRFGRVAIGPAALRFEAVHEQWIVDITVHTAAGTVMAFECGLLEFPSDKMISDIALVT